MAKSKHTRLSPRQVQEELIRLRGLFYRDHLMDQPEGSHLPSVNEVSAEYSISFALARKLYDAMQEEGLVTSQPRKGYFAADVAPGTHRGRKAPVIALAGYLELSHPGAPQSHTAQILETFEKLANERSWRVEFINTYPERTLTEDQLLHMAKAGLDAVIYLPYSQKDNSITNLLRLDIPILTVETPHPGVTTIDYDNRLTGYRMGQYLLDCGFGRQAFVGLKGQRWSLLRCQGYLEAFTEIPAKPTVHEVRDSEAGIKRCVATLKKQGVEAIFCANDQIALSLREHGLDTSIALAGVDDKLESRVHNLTTIQRSYAAIAEMMVKQLSVALEKGLTLPEHVYLEGQLLKRGSTEHLRRRQEVRYA